jgi:hypothetical protein
MATQKFINPKVPASGAGTFSDDLVGFQLVQGGGLTQGNFEFVEGTREKQNRTFNTGIFSEPFNLDNLKIGDVEQSKLIVENNFKVYPNFDLSQITSFTQFGSLTKRVATSIQQIISFFPAAIEVTFMASNYTTGVTAYNIVYNPITNVTSFDLDVSRIRNPFDIDFTTNSTRNLDLREIKVSPLRNFPLEFNNYALFLNGIGFDVVSTIPSSSSTIGILNISVNGDAFSGSSFTYVDIIIRPNDLIVNKVFNEDFDEVENFLLNRNVTPIYTSTFKVPRETENGSYYIYDQILTFPLYGNWNIDIITKSFESYLTELNEVAVYYDSYKTNLISRFLTTGAFKDFDTPDQNVEKVLQIYGRSFDETKKFIDALAFMNSVHYNVGNDIPSQLLKNFAETLGWRTNISPISEDELLSSVFGQKNISNSQFAGVSKPSTPDELNYQFYRNLILNTAFLFKSKGTRKSIENLLKLIGAPDALVEFNENIYLADDKINLNQFENKYLLISGGTYIQEIPSLEPANTFKIQGKIYTGFTTQLVIEDSNVTRNDYPIDQNGFPYSPEDTEDYFFQKGSGWFEQTPSHRAPEQVNLTNSTFTGQNPSYQTSLIPYTYGQIYLNRYRYFPFMNPLGFTLFRIPDNNKSWVNNEIGLRRNNDGGFNAYYFTQSDNLVLNVKNVELNLNVGQGLTYDVWYMSRQYDYPIPNAGLNTVSSTTTSILNIITNQSGRLGLTYPQRGGYDWTLINPQPKRKTFFEFAQTFWINMINVRNRLYVKDGKTSGYPTLQSIYWRYLESQELAGIENNNFTYRTMMEYVDGLGDYWIRLVEQMIPASTIWIGGVKYENSPFHRQKFIWRRQDGCQLIPIPCKPCTLDSSIFPIDCPVFSVECPIYPWDVNTNIQNIASLFGFILNNYLSTTNYSLNSCDLSTLQSDWYVQLELNNVIVEKYKFFTGTGYTTPGVSYPNVSSWDLALVQSLSNLLDDGYDYYLTDTDTVILMTNNCNGNNTTNFEIKIGINFNLICS